MTVAHSVRQSPTQARRGFWNDHSGNPNRDDGQVRGRSGRSSRLAGTEAAVSGKPHSPPESRSNAKGGPGASGGPWTGHGHGKSVQARGHLHGNRPRGKAKRTTSEKWEQHGTSRHETGSPRRRRRQRNRRSVRSNHDRKLPQTDARRQSADPGSAEDAAGETPNEQTKRHRGLSMYISFWYIHAI